MRPRLLGALICLAVCALISPGQRTTAADQDPRLPKAGSAMPAFALPDLSGRTVDVSAYRGQPLVLNYWAFWCDTWKAEYPCLTELAGRQKDLGFKLIAVSVDGKRVDTFRAGVPDSAPFPVLLDLGGRVSAEYGVWRVPTVIVLDGEGRVVYAHSGYPGNGPILAQLEALANARLKPSLVRPRN